MYFFFVFLIKNFFEREGVGIYAFLNYFFRSVRVNFFRKGRKLLFFIRFFKFIVFVVILLLLFMFISCL